METTCVAHSWIKFRILFCCWRCCSKNGSALSRVHFHSYIRMFLFTRTNIHNACTHTQVAAKHAYLLARVHTPIQSYIIHYQTYIHKLIFFCKYLLFVNLILFVVFLSHERALQYNHTVNPFCFGVDPYHDDDPYSDLYMIYLYYDFYNLLIVDFCHDYLSA